MEMEVFFLKKDKEICQFRLNLPIKISYVPDFEIFDPGHTGPEVVNKSNFLHVNFDKFDVFTA